MSFLLKFTFASCMGENCLHHTRGSFVMGLDHHVKTISQ